MRKIQNSLVLWFNPQGVPYFFGWHLRLNIYTYMASECCTPQLIKHSQSHLCILLHQVCIHHS